MRAEAARVALAVGVAGALGPLALLLGVALQDGPAQGLNQSLILAGGALQAFAFGSGGAFAWAASGLVLTAAFVVSRRASAAVGEGPAPEA